MKAADYKTKSKADAYQYAQFVRENFEPFDWPTRPSRKRRRLSLTRAINQARKAGADVLIAPDGSVTLRFSEAVVGHVPTTPANEWDTVQ
jgi:hypothetical protein